MQMREIMRIAEGFKSDEQIIEYYMEGNCWSLAVAHHRRFGWPIYCLGGYEDETERDDWRTISFHHVLVKHPTGEAVDIQGPHNVQTLLEDWGDVEFLPLTEIQLRSLVTDKAPTESEVNQANDVIDHYMMKKFPKLYV
jgi:hypothetical protein